MSKEFTQFPTLFMAKNRGRSRISRKRGRIRRFALKFTANFKIVSGGTPAKSVSE
jgi:hypothetical protein